MNPKEIWGIHKRLTVSITFDLPNQNYTYFKLYRLKIPVNSSFVVIAKTKITHARIKFHRYTWWETYQEINVDSGSSVTYQQYWL